MTTNTDSPRIETFITARLPWILGAGMLVVFLTTLNHWLTPHGLGEVLDISQWSHRQHVFGPLIFLVTYPLRWLPWNTIPIALNLFSAICAALTLVLLARSVAILPHDRTFEQRQREQSEFSFLTISTAWIPPLFAVLVCGLQLTFWSDAIEATGEMFDLLLFAYVIRCLLEFRLSQKDSLLFRAAFVYGLAMANNWAMVGFFPLFLVASIWTKGLGNLNVRFLVRLVLFGLTGCLLFFLLPLINSFQHYTNDTFWGGVHLLIHSEKAVLMSMPREVVLLLALTSILPIFVMGIRWASYFGDNSPLGIFLATTTFHIVHGLFLIACLWVVLDAPISPRNKGLGYHFLPFYFLGALSVGYFSGYFLLVFGAKISRSRQAINPMLKTVNTCAKTCIFVLLVAVPIMQITRNYPHIKTAKQLNQIYDRFFTAVETSLPAQGAVVLSDDPFRLYYLQAALIRAGKGSAHLLIDTSLLINDPDYPIFLAQKNPQYQLPTSRTTKGTNAPPVLEVIRLLDQLGQSHPLYYVHPSFGFFFERYSMEPNGLIYRLNPYPTNIWDMPVPTPGQITQNQNFWKNNITDVLPAISELLNRDVSAPPTNTWQKFENFLNLKEEKDWSALHIGGLYSRSLNYWGVDLQRAGQLADAGKHFDEAITLNPLNVAARINSLFNSNLLAKTTMVVNPPKNIEDYFGQRRNWTDVLGTDGPLDEPNFRDALAGVLAEGGNYRQAVQQLDRVKQIVPADPRASLQLAQLLLYTQTYTNPISVLLPPPDQCYAEALANADSVLKKYTNEPTALFLKSVALMQTKAYDKAIAPLDLLISVQTTNYAARLNRAIAYFKTGNYPAAQRDYEVVGKVAPSAYQVYYGLGEIAFEQKDNATAIKNYQMYLSNAPSSTEEAKYVAGRLNTLTNSAAPPSGKPPG